MFASNVSQRANGRTESVPAFPVHISNRSNGRASESLSSLTSKDRELETHWVEAIEFATD